MLRSKSDIDLEEYFADQGAYDCEQETLFVLLSYRHAPLHTVHNLGYQLYVLRDLFDDSLLDYVPKVIYST